MAGLDLRLSGGAQLLELRKDLKRIGDRGLGQRMDAGLRKAAKPITPAVQAEAASTMPKAGGYAALLAAAIRGRLQSRSSRYAARITLRVYADGKGEKRDLPRINAGMLRHPVYGRYRRVRGRKVERPWVSQRVRPGVVDRPFDEAAPEVQREMIKVMDELVAELAKG